MLTYVTIMATGTLRRFIACRLALVSPIYSSSTLNMHAFPVGETCIDFLLITWSFLPFNYTLSYLRLYRLVAYSGFKVQNTKDMGKTKKTLRQITKCNNEAESSMAKHKTQWQTIGTKV